MVRERVRRRAGRTTQPSAGISARQSRKTTRVGGMRGYDGGKQISGRKRHLLGATRGLVVRAKVHAADLQDRAAVPVLVQGADAEVPTIALVGLIAATPARARSGLVSSLGGRSRSCTTHRALGAPGNGEQILKIQRCCAFAGPR
jgi:hypothetical protein